MIFSMRIFFEALGRALETTNLASLAFLNYRACNQTKLRFSIELNGLSKNIFLYLQDWARCVMPDGWYFMSKVSSLRSWFSYVSGGRVEDKIWVYKSQPDRETTCKKITEFLGSKRKWPFSTVTHLDYENTMKILQKAIWKEILWSLIRKILPWNPHKLNWE